MSRAVVLASLALFAFTPRLLAVPAPVSPHDTVHVAPAVRDTLAGTWRVDDADPAPIVIRRAGYGYVLTRAGLWSGHGQLVGHRYEGQFESQRATGDTMRVAGLHYGRFRGDRRIDVTVVYTRGRHGTRREVWRRVEAPETPDARIHSRDRVRTTRVTRAPAPPIPRSGAFPAPQARP